MTTNVLLAFCEGGRGAPSAAPTPRETTFPEATSSVSRKTHLWAASDATTPINLADTVTTLLWLSREGDTLMPSGRDRHQSAPPPEGAVYLPVKAGKQSVLLPVRSTRRS
jgi:hypothetical protein